MDKLSKIVTSTMLGVALVTGIGACNEDKYPVSIQSYYDTLIKGSPPRPVVEARVGQRHMPTGKWDHYLSDDNANPEESVWTNYIMDGINVIHKETILESELPGHPEGSCNKYMSIDWDKGEEWAENDFCPTTSLETNMEYAKQWAERIQKEFKNKD